MRIGRVGRYVYAAAVVTALVLAVGLWNPFMTGRVTANFDEPEYKVDPNWPKTLPNRWQIGQVPGIAVDRDDHIWIVQRPRTLTSDERGASPFEPGTGSVLDGPARPQGAISDCCLPAPSVMQFDRQGHLLRAWGGPVDPGRCVEPACEWPNTEHGIYVDHNMNVWLGGQAGRAVLKFTADGTFLLQIGRRLPPMRESNRTDGGLNGTPLLGQPADMEVDPETNELYIADGYTNLRIIVVDAVTGMYRRHWGAYGQNPVDDTGNVGPYIKDQPPAPHFRNPVHAVRITKDGLVYVADRVNNRIQVFDKERVGLPCQNPTGARGVCGFVGEIFIATDTLGPGSTWDVDVSPDRQQTFLFNADGSNNYIWTLLRRTGQILGTFGRNGRNAGQFHWVHNLAVDSRGNIYTSEVDTGKRVQKFKPGDDDHDRDERERDKRDRDRDNRNHHDRDRDNRDRHNRR
jgi:DNA-binding beta-propeller fold protein YncE